MATTITEAELAIILRAKNQTDKAFKELETHIKITEREMSGLHSEALRMNAAFQTSSQRAGGLADSVGKVSTVMARAATTFGLPAEALRGLDVAADAAEIGLKNLSTSAAGFTTASLGVVGAGLAIGTMLGGLLRQADETGNGFVKFMERMLLFGTTVKDVDKAVEGIWARLSGAPPPTSIEDLAIAATKAEISFRQVGIAQQKADMATVASTRRAIEGQLAMGVSLEQIRERYKDLSPALEGWVKGLERSSDAQRKSAAEAKTAAAEAKRSAKEQADAILKAQEAHEDYKDALIDVTLAQIAYQKEIGDGAAIAQAEFNSRQMLKTILEQQEAYESAEDSMKEFYEKLAKAAEDAAQAEADRIRDQIEGIHSLGEAFATVGDLLVTLGVKSDSVLVKMADGFSNVAHAAGDFAAALASGNIFDKIGAGIGLLTTTIGAVKNIFRDEEEDVNDLRDVFVAAAGGITELDKKAQAAGLTVKDLLNADTVKEYEAAIRQLASAFDTQAEAQRLTNEAIDRYGFTIEELGPKFAQQRLDEQFATLFQDYQLLNAAGVDHNAILARMGPSLNEYVNSAIKAGGTIPEAMRPVVEEMIKNGQLLDENGEAYESVEAAGLKFAQTLEEGIGKLIDKITQLVNAMLGIPTDINTNINVNTHHTSSGSSGGGPGGKPEENSFAGGGAVTQWGVPAILHGTQSNPEFALRKEHFQEIAKIMSANGGSNGGGGGVVQVFIGGEQLDHVIMKRLKGGHIRVPKGAVSDAGF